MKKFRYVILAALMMVPLYAMAIDLTQNAYDFDKANPMESIAMLEEKFGNVFTKFGTPKDLLAGDQTVVIDYGPVCFRVKDKVITQVQFWTPYAGDVNGAKIGMSKKELQQAWGKPDQSQKSSKGKPWLLWKKDKLWYQAFLDDDDNVQYLQFEVLE